MTYLELVKKVSNDDELSREIYICCFINCKKEKMKNAKITLIKNILGFYVVTQWLDYEYQKYLERKNFSDKDEAANFVWNLVQKNLHKNM